VGPAVPVSPAVPDFSFAPEVEAFRREVRTWLEEEMATGRTAAHGDDTDLTGLDGEFERGLLERAGQRGFLGVSLPPELGGGGRPASFQAAFNLEVARADAPLIDTAITLTAQPIVAWGSPEQQRFFLPRMVSGELITCIAYTEPEAGSDLAALSTTAESDGGGFRLQGVKSLVTGPHKADWCCTIARTRPDVHVRDGLSMFMVAMDSPGVTVRRHRTMTGWTLGEVEFDQVALGPGALLGQRDRGWGQLVSAVATEGGGMFHIGFAHHVLDLLVAYATDTVSGGRRLADDPVVRDRIAGLWIELGVAERLARRSVWLEEQGQPNAVEASMGKVVATELLQRLAGAALDLAGPDGSVVRPLFGPGSSHATGEGRFGWEYLERVHGTIGGGTNEMKRTLIARAGLGLPR
jgi:alkylation response protein AidB-like acyl-CoA dehydrogenase